MSMKKTAFITIFISAIFVGVNFMIAQAYDPLVRLPGLPATGSITLSEYIVGLYNFLLSIVGIVAVMMLIIGGMKYITAAGNSATIADAKDTISSAIFGLLLALLSWVIVSTINPDVLYIKNPATSFVDPHTDDLSACGVYDGAAIAPTPNCTCSKDVIPAVTFVGVVDEDACEVACADHCNLTDSLPCLGMGSADNKPFENEDGNLSCSCIDGDTDVVVNYGPAPAAPDSAGCNEVCSNPDFAKDNKYHGVKVILDIFTLDDNNEMIPISRIYEETFTLKTDKDYFFDFSNSYDCGGEIVSFAIEFTGGKPNFLLGDVPDRWCCMIDDAACPSTWGECCNTLGCLFLVKPPKCDDIDCSLVLEQCTYFEPNEDNSNYPIYKGSYSSDGLKELWIGITNRTLSPIIRCYEDTEKVFSVRVED